HRDLRTNVLLVENDIHRLEQETPDVPDHPRGLIPRVEPPDNEPVPAPVVMAYDRMVRDGYPLEQEQAAFHRAQGVQQRGARRLQDAIALTPQPQAELVID